MIDNSLFDIGRRAFVFGGAYGNLQATEAILAEAKQRGFSHEQVIFTGDTVAYCGQPAETVSLVRDSGIHVVMGNCEESLGEDADDCGCGFEEGTECSLLSVEWYRFCREALDQDAKAWMSKLPKTMALKVGSHVLKVTHATPQAINEFVFPSDLDSGAFVLQIPSNADGYIAGHSGIPFLAETNGKAWINSGAAGMPANDGTPRVWFATLESIDGELIAETQALDYDHQTAIAAMEKAGLNNGYKDCLASGIWPSHDVLPEAEKAITGRPLATQKKHYVRASEAQVA